MSFYGSCIILVTGVLPVDDSWMFLLTSMWYVYYARCFTNIDGFGGKSGSYTSSGTSRWDALEEFMSCFSVYRTMYMTPRWASKTGCRACQSSCQVGRCDAKRAEANEGRDRRFQPQNEQVKRSSSRIFKTILVNIKSSCFFWWNWWVFWAFWRLMKRICLQL